MGGKTSRSLPAQWKTLPKGRVVVLAPHPDDETIGCGGALALHHEQGDAVKVVFVTDGAKGDFHGHYQGLDYVQLRRSEARRAAEVLGINSVEFWAYPDGRLSRALDLAERLKALLEKERPDMLYTPDPGDPHPDHAFLAKQCKEALRRHTAKIMSCRYEVTSALQPTHVVDISKVWYRKLQALRQYRSQLHYTDYTHLILRASLFRSLFLRNCRHAEAYQVSCLP